MLERVGVRLGEVAELAGVDNPEYAGGLSVEGGEGAQANGGSEASEATHFGPQRTYGSTSGTSTPALARPVSPPSLSSSRSATPAPSSPSSSSAAHLTPSDEAAKYSTDPVLTSSQLFQIKNLNAIPQLRKHFVYLPHARNAHGAIVRRDPSYAAHKAGIKVIDAWAREFQV